MFEEKISEFYFKWWSDENIKEEENWSKENGYFWSKEKEVPLKIGKKLFIAAGAFIQNPF